MVTEVKPESFMEKYLGMPLDVGLFACASKISPDYMGGVWKFVVDGNVGYGYPDTKDTFLCENPAAFYECRASAEVLGMAATLMFLNLESWLCASRGYEKKGKWYSDQYYALYNWMFENFSDEDASKVHLLLD